MPELTTEAQIREVLARARTIAVLGAHDQPSRPAFYVPDYLHRQGYKIIPVNPALAGQTLWGEVVRRELAGIAEPVDIVDIFRRSEALVPAHEADILAMKPRPKVVWLQLGIRSDELARAMTAVGIDVVQDRCTLADHRRMGIGPITP